MPDTTIEDYYPRLSFEELKAILGLTIKGDDVNKLITFLCGIMAYTESAQFNISFNAPSSTGKSYIPLEVTALFPEEDVLHLGHCTPTAFFYDLTEYDEESGVGNVDLSRKIIVFMDQPHFLLLERLRPLLSHDKKQLLIKATDKSDKGGHRTKNITVIGFPAVIFCTAGLGIDEQEATRFILLSPDMGQEKIRAAINERIKKGSDERKYRAALDSDPMRQNLMRRIKAIKEAGIADIKIEDEEKVKELFLARNAHLKPRHMRDIGKVMAIIKGSALLNLWFRKRDGDTIITNDYDVEQGFNVWDSIYLSQELNLPPCLLEFYNQVILPLCKDGRITFRKEIQAKYLTLNHSALRDDILRQQMLPMLEAAGLIIQEPDPEDKRRVMIYIPQANLGAELVTKNIVSRHRGWFYAARI